MSLCYSDMYSICIIFAVCIYTVNADSFILHNNRQLALSDQKWEIQYSLNLTEYKETSKLLNDGINRINSICNLTQNYLCTYFKHAIRHIESDIDTDISKLNTLSRKKRSPISIFSLNPDSIIPRAIITSVIFSLNNNLREASLDASSAAINFQENVLKDTDEKFETIQKMIETNSQFYSIMNLIILTAHIHEKLQTKLNYILYGEIHSHLFEIIDYKLFRETITNINKKLQPDFTLPHIGPLVNNEHIETYLDHNNTHVTISIDLPIIQNKQYDMFELIPIPMLENTSLYVLDTNIITAYRNGSEVQEISNNAQCTTNKKLTICDNSINLKVEKMSTCTQNLLINGTDESCAYKKIPYHNYFIRISDDSLYAFLTAPIQLIKHCRGKDYTLNLNSSLIIPLQKGCTLYKFSKNSHYFGQKSTKIDVTPEKLHDKIDFYASERESTPMISLYDKYEMQFIESKAQLMRVTKAAPLVENNSSQDDGGNTSFFGGIFNKIKENTIDIIKNIAIQYLIYIFIILLILMIMKEIIIKLVTNWRR